MVTFSCALFHSYQAGWFSVRRNRQGMYVSDMLIIVFSVFSFADKINAVTCCVLYSG